MAASGTFSEGWAVSVELLEAFWHTVTADGVPVAARLPPRDAVVLVVFAIYTAALFALNWGTRLCVIDPLARWVLRRGGHGAPAKKTHVEKFSQSAVEAITYGCFTVFGVMLVPSQDFFWPSSRWWYPRAEGKLIHDDLICFYILYCARYVQAGVSVLMEHKRRDFTEMMVHHVVTAVLVAVSYCYDFLHIGVIVMLLLDPADVPLHVAKLWKYTSEACPKGSRRARYYQMFADRFFEVFAVTFFVTRIVLYPYTCWSATVESVRYSTLDVEGYVCLVLLYTLLVLQCMWMYLIIKAIVNMFQKGGIEDVRSDTEDEDATKKRA